MAYGTKSKYVRKYARKGRVARMAKGKTTSVQALAKAVSSIQRSMRTKCEYLNYTQSGDVGVSGDLTSVSLSDYANWVGCFGSGANDAEQNKIVHQSFGMDLRVTLENSINNEENTTGFTCMLVSLKDDVGADFNPSTSALSLSSPNHYVIREGMVLVNKKVFTIHKQKRFTLSNYGTALTASAAQTQYGTDMRWYWKLSPRKMIQNPYGDWKSLRSGGDPSKTYYLFIFNDNSSLDGENPALKYNIVHTVKTVA